jgi:GntR family transcriptional regulator / MocR family aminotransferase
MITMFFDKDDKSPLYEQIYRHIKAEIDAGKLNYGEKLPSKRQLSEHLKISAVTVETAYSQLRAEGYLRSIEKSGYYVDSSPFPKISKNRLSEGELKDTKEAMSYCYDYRTNVVDTDLFPYSVWSRLMRTVLSENPQAVLNHSHPQGFKVLREEISVYLNRFRGIEASPEQIVVGAGSEMLLNLLIQILGRNQGYATENPGYAKVKQIMLANDVRHIDVGLDRQGLSVEQLKKTEAKVVHVTPSHQFPTGTVMPVKRRIELLNWAEAALDRYIIEDDYDSEFSVGVQPIPALQGMDHSEKVIYLNTFSKSIAPSLRIGYLVLPPHLLKRYREKQTFGACTVPNFEQLVLAKFMNGGAFESHLNRMRNAYKRRRDSLMGLLITNRIVSKTDIIGFDAGLHFLINVRNGMGETELVESAKRVGVRVYGLSEYFVGTFPDAPPLLVIGYSGLKENDMRESVELMRLAWDRSVDKVSIADGVEEKIPRL